MPQLDFYVSLTARNNWRTVGYILINFILSLRGDHNACSKQKRSVSKCIFAWQPFDRTGTGEKLVSSGCMYGICIYCYNE
jgi:hypothetical protein